MKKVICYCRVSTSTQSSAMQLKKINEYCKYKGWELSEVYEDHGVSGAKDSRPELNRLKKEVEKGKVDVVLVYKYERLARSTSHLLDFLNFLGSHETDFVSCCENVDTSTSMGRLIFSFLASIAEYQRQDIVNKVNDGIARAKADGVVFGRPRKGFDVAKAIEMKNQGHGYRRIGKELGVSYATIFNTLKKLDSVK